MLFRTRRRLKKMLEREGYCENTTDSNAVKSKEKKHRHLFIYAACIAAAVVVGSIALLVIKRNPDSVSDDRKPAGTDNVQEFVADTVFQMII